MSDEKQYLFAAGELEAVIRSTVAYRHPNLGYVIDSSIILGSIVDIVMFGAPVKQRFSPLEILTDLNVPSDIAKETISYLCDTINRALTIVIGEIKPGKVYDWIITPFQDLVITEKTAPLRVYPRDQRTTEDLAAESLKNAIENGDYIPEKTRRLFGL